MRVNERTIFNNEIVGAGCIPMNAGIGGGDTRDRDIVGTGARGDIIHLDIVEIDIACGAGSGKSDEMAIAHIIAERNLEELPLIDICRRNSSHSGESGEVVGVGHHTHLDRIVGRSFAEGKTDLETVDRGSHGRQTKVGVVGCGAVEIDGVSAAIGIRGGEIRIGIVGITGATSPAVGDGRASGTGSHEILEVFGEGEFGERNTGGGYLYLCKDGIATAVGSDALWSMKWRFEPYRKETMMSLCSREPR